jgi:Family of unknown function (DUF5996)
MSTKSNLILSEWPALPFSEWESTCDTLHMWTQIVGKTRMALEPLVNHWWNVALYVTPVGLSTSLIPYKDKVFEVELDLVSHRLQLRTGEGREYSIPLYPRSVADFYREYMGVLRSARIDVRINRIPAEFDDLTPYDEDRHHASYDKEYVERFRRILTGADHVLKTFRASFLGKSSPVHFFWGSFDLAVTRFSGRRAPEQPNADPISREGYSHEVISCGFWPGDRRFKTASFYSYTAPTPQGLAEEFIRPHAAYWEPLLGEFILKYDDVRAASSPEAAILDFCQSTYEAGAKRANWDRAALER